MAGQGLTARDVARVLASLRDTAPAAAMAAQRRFPGRHAWESTTDPDVVPLLTAALRDGSDSNSMVRHTVAVVLGRMGDPRAVDPLILSLQNDRRPVKRAAAIALGRFKDARAVAALVAALSNASDSWVEEAAENALVAIGATAVDSLLAAVGRSDGTPLLRAADALAKIGAPAQAQLVAALRDSNPGVREWSAWALGMQKYAHAAAPLVALLRDSVPDVRTKAARSLEWIGAPAVGPLVAALRDSGDVKRLAAHVLAELLKPFTPLGKSEITTVARALDSAFAARDLVVTAAAHRYYIRRGAPGSEVQLIEALDAHGAMAMANDFLNAGNDRLATAARAWADRRGLRVRSERGLPFSPTWGTRKP